MLVILLLTVKYMSLSTLAALAAGLVFIVLCGAAAPVYILTSVSVAIVFVRHSKNIKRLVHGEEPKFSLGQSSSETKEAKE